MNSDMPTGAQMILEERRRQIVKEGWTSEHDDAHTEKEIARAADTYMGEYIGWSDDETGDAVPECWPWDASWWKPSTDPIRNLVKAGALIAAEIDRLQRLRN